ncbi:GNAT family N-acetyltransferase [Tumebacillus flagellatus]|uniref:N-acetyltransferase domain-containing protein n=1 Tax=Tumebacillus flagellatus TaxID=1157490 RepID=A0A074LNI7_9BACL|nr:GNAT family N-acetyltransferase [Tumebacillus flagellatus]KEO83701.1 hypothetical protein EL26_08600 [Tumebacillus flagellatus]
MEGPYVLAHYEGAAAGQLELQVKQVEGREVGYVSIMYLVPELRGQGISQQMWDYAESFFRRLGMAEYQLKVDVGNERAKRFYLKSGMEVLGEEPNSMGDPCYRLAKKLFY